MKIAGVIFEWCLAFLAIALMVWAFVFAVSNHHRQSVNDPMPLEALAQHLLRACNQAHHGLTSDCTAYVSNAITTHYRTVSMCKRYHADDDGFYLCLTDFGITPNEGN